MDITHVIFTHMITLITLVTYVGSKWRWDSGVFWVSVGHHVMDWLGVVGRLGKTCHYQRKSLNMFTWTSSIWCDSSRDWFNQTALVARNVHILISYVLMYLRTCMYVYWSNVYMTSFIYTGVNDIYTYLCSTYYCHMHMYRWYSWRSTMMLNDGATYTRISLWSNYWLCTDVQLTCAMRILYLLIYI